MSRSLRVVINAVAARMGGAATHLPNFLHTAGRRYPDDAFIACVNSEWHLPALPSNIRLVDVGALRNRFVHAAWDQWGIARVAVREHADVLLSLLNFGPIRSPVPQVVLERNPVYFCPFYLAALGRGRALEVAATRALAHAVMRAARRVVTPSAAMREMIRACYPDLPPAKFRVIPHGFGVAAFRGGAPVPGDAAAQIAASNGVRILYVSHAASYKGIELLLEAGRVLRDDVALAATMWLTIAREDWPKGFPRYVAFIERHGLQAHVRLLGRIPHGAVHRIYEAADLFVYPSLCESFGFPLVEAMASGLPIVAADLPLNHEMCGDAAVYYPPRDPAALARQVAGLARDPDLRARLAAAGRARAGRFSWDDHVDEVMAVVREAAADAG
ncbi:MAG TPA: glycosyltransferase family 1 protein [bacterium]|nr:glycosyltransferase family 1 protein [bacterium]